MALLLLLVLQLSLLAVGACADPARYHTLVVTPLSPNPSTTREAQAQPVPSTSVATIMDDDDRNNNASSVELLHRHAFAPPNTTASQLLGHRMARDAARAGEIRLLSSQNQNRTRRGRAAGSLSAPVVSGLSLGSGEYLARVGVGTPPSPALLVLDTGSDVVWLQCAPCRRCYPQSPPGSRVFDPRRSRSYAFVACAAPICGSGGCDERRGTCLYHVTYGDGSITAGDLATETLTFGGGRGRVVPRVAIGCGHYNQGLFVAAAGILGLGRGRLSFPTQTARRSFSYCLADRTSPRRKPTRRPSTLTFGIGSADRPTFTPMLRNPAMPTFYYVRLVGFTVGGARVKVGKRGDQMLRLDPSTGSGGVILDSGTSVTRLARPVYAALRAAFRAATTRRLPSAGEGFSVFDTCYDLAGRKAVRVPTLSMRFAGGAEVALPPENYLIPVDTRGKFCFAFAPTDGGVSIIGNIQQQGFRVLFDGDRHRVAFLPNSC